MREVSFFPPYGADCEGCILVKEATAALNVDGADVLTISCAATYNPRIAKLRASATVIDMAADQPMSSVNWVGEGSCQVGVSNTTTEE